MKRELKITDFEEVFERKVVMFGNSSHIILPHKHTGKKAIIIIEQMEKSTGVG